MPVFESPSYHGYDTTDYGKINADYGTNADFLKLLDEAHRRGIRVIVDLVVNHSGSGHPWFVRRPPRRRRPIATSTLEPDGPGLEAALGRKHRYLAPQRRRVLLRRLLERDARPELALSGASRGGEEDRLPLARTGRRRLPPRRDALPRRDGCRAVAGRHAGNPRRSEGVRRARSAREARGAPRRGELGRHEGHRDLLRLALRSRRGRAAGQLRLPPFRQDPERPGPGQRHADRQQARRSSESLSTGRPRRPVPDEPRPGPPRHAAREAPGTAP